MAIPSSNPWGMRKRRPARKKPARSRESLIRRVDCTIQVLGSRLEVADTIPGRLFLSPLFTNDFSSVTLRFLSSRPIAQGKKVVVVIERAEGKIKLCSEVLWCRENLNLTHVVNQNPFPFRVEVVFRKNFSSDDEEKVEESPSPSPNVSELLFRTFFPKIK